MPALRIAPCLLFNLLTSDTVHVLFRDMPKILCNHVLFFRLFILRLIFGLLLTTVCLFPEGSATVSPAKALFLNRAEMFKKKIEFCMSV